MGGDEFLLFYAVQKEQAEPLVKRIFDLLCGQYKEFRVSVSMGIACAEECGGDYSVLFHMADEAMYEAKSRRGRYCFIKRRWRIPEGKPDKGSAVRLFMKERKVFK